MMSHQQSLSLSTLILYVLNQKDSCHSNRLTLNHMGNI